MSIEAGLAPASAVVVDGADRLREGAKVEIADRDRRMRRPARAKAAGKGEARKRRRKAGAAMNPSRLFILRPVATSLLMVAILLAGRSSPTACCRSRRCPRSTTRPSRW